MLNTGEPEQATAMLRIFNGDEEPFNGPVSLIVHNGSDVKPTSFNGRGPHIYIKVPFHNGIGDFYAVCVSSDSYRDSGFFFKADSKVLAQPKVVLLPKQPTFHFPLWASLKAHHPQTASFLEVGNDESAAMAL